ncbi:MAG TPA: hypothetical protein DF383_09225 [Deltaproteobacteria bacterium]|nr:hypothetical protein [Deltaproteobacteria bacterium]
MNPSFLIFCRRFLTKLFTDFLDSPEKSPISCASRFTLHASRPASIGGLDLRAPKKRWLYLILLSLWAFPVSAQILEQTFTDEAAEFKISTPDAHWHFLPRGSVPGEIRATLRYEAPVHQFIPNATVRVETLGNPKLGAEKLLEKSLKTFPDSVELIEKNALNHRGISGYEILLHDRNSKAVFHQWLFAAKGKIFLVTCTANVESYTRMRQDFQKILDSFEILSS